MSAIGYTVAVLGIVSVGGLVGALAWAVVRRVRRQPRGLSGATALTRAASYAILALVLGCAAWFGTPGIAALAGVLGAIGLWEWGALADLPIHHRIALQISNVVIVLAVAAMGSNATQWLVGGIVLVGIIWPVVRADPGRAIRDLGFAAVGCIVIPGMLAAGVALAAEQGEIGAVTFVAIAVGAAGSDVGAFLVGRRFGNAPLAPRLSPAKTRAGVIGNLFGAAVGILLFSPVLVLALGPVLVIVLIPIVGLGALWGDLLESAVKREAGMKDAGSWLPGFGGILDRIDSLLVVLPLTYWTIRLADVVQVR